MLTVLLIIIISGKAKLQTIELIPNLNPSHVGFVGKPIVFNGELYFFYETTNHKTQLAKYNGTGISLFANPDTNDLGCFGEPIIFNNELYFGYIVGNTSFFHLAKFNGNNISVINNPNNLETGYYGSSVIFNNNLYFAYENNLSKMQLAKYDGNNITKIPNLSNDDFGILYEQLIVFNNQLYFGYNIYPNGHVLAQYNGSSIILFPNPVPDNIYNGFAGNLFIYNNNLYFLFQNSILDWSMGKLDSNSVSIAVNNFEGGQIQFNNDLYFIYPAAPIDNYHLGKFNGFIDTLYPNFYINDYGFSGDPILYKENLFYPYYNHFGKTLLSKINSNSISLIPNPDTLSRGISRTPFVYGKNLYYGYINSSNNTQIAKYDGTILSLLPNPDSISKGYFGFPIQYNNNMYFQYCVSLTPIIYQLARFTDSTVTVGKPLFKDNPISLYPNPATNQLTIENLKKASNICIFDINGRILYDNEAEKNLQIDISNLAKGIYIVKIKNETDVSFRKFIIE